MMISFRIFNVPIGLRFGFFAIPAIVLCFESAEYFLPVMLAYTAHEAGHILAAKILKTEITEICFGALGISMKGNMLMLSPMRRAAISLAGPLVNFILFALLLPFGSKWYAAQLLLFVFHILPAVPLDGGMALYGVLCSIEPEQKAARQCTVISAVLAFLLGLLGFSVLLRTKGNFTMLLTACYILIYVIKKRRDDLC